MVIKGSINTANLNDNLAYSGNLRSNNFDIIALMQTLGYIEYEAEFSGGLEPTEIFGFELYFEGNNSELTLERFNGNLGETEIQAVADFRFGDEYGPSSTRYELRTSSIDLSPFISVASDDVDPDDPFSSKTLETQNKPFNSALQQHKYA